MAWVKIPKAHHAIFRDALPESPRAVVIPLFGGLGAKVGGQLACALFGRSIMVRLDPAGCAEILAMDGGAAFDPRDRGVASAGKVMLPESMLDERDELRAWVRRALDYTATLPKQKTAAKPAAKKPAKPKPAKPKSARAYTPRTGRRSGSSRSASRTASR